MDIQNNPAGAYPPAGGWRNSGLAVSEARPLLLRRDYLASGIDDSQCAIAVRNVLNSGGLGCRIRQRRGHRASVGV